MPDASASDASTGAKEPEPVLVGAVDRPLLLSVLAFSRTTGFRHGSIADAHEFFQDLDSAEQLSIEVTEDAAAFTSANLARFDVVAFVNTSGDVLDEAQQTALEALIRGGRGFVRVHAAADTEHDWPWYGELTPPGPSMGADHPVAWYRGFDGGRSFYTNLGHTSLARRDELFQEHLLERIRSAAGGGYTAVARTASRHSRRGRAFNSSSCRGKP